MAGVTGAVKVVVMASGAGIGRIGIVALMAVVTIDTDMRAGQWIEGIMVKSRGRPCGFGVAKGAISRESCVDVAGICGGDVIVVMTGGAGVWRIGVVTVMASGAIVSDRGMSAIQGVVGVMNRERSGFPTGGRGMAHRAIGW